MLIQKLRLHRGWSQQQLADLSGLSVRTVQRLEQGQSASVESLKSLAAVFEIDFSELQRTNMPPIEPSATATPSRTINTHALTKEEALALHHVRKLKGFYMHFIKYLIVISVLLAINLWQGSPPLWVVWPALGWGMGILFHAASVFETIPFGPAWEKRQVEKRLGREI